MKQQLVDYIAQQLSTRSIAGDQIHRYIKRLNEGKLTREENPLSHMCAMFLTYNPTEKKVLVVHHKKAKSWIFPGGHIEKGELPFETAAREAEEEIGVSIHNILLSAPFGAQVLDIDNPPQICREHYDIFYALASTANKVIVNPKEFHDYEWISADEAFKRIELAYYRVALKKFVAFISW